MSYLMDYYRTLQVHHEASAEIIEAAYRRLSKLNHPDLNHNPAAMERMKQINLAYETLTDSQRRREYHKQWLQLVSGKDPYSHWRGSAEAFMDASYQVVDGYFHDLMMGNWVQAYHRLTRADRQRISLKEFSEWKTEVSRVFQLGSYALKLFRKHRDCHLADALYPEVREYSVYTCDKQVLTGRVNEETIPKYVAWDDDAWRVCLGYRDLKPFILKLRHMASQRNHLNPDRTLAEAMLRVDGQTGMLSRYGLMGEFEREATRSQRYRNPFTIAMVNVLPVKKIREFHRDQYQEVCLEDMANMMQQVFRQTDIMGRWSEMGFAVLFTETREEDAQTALDKLTQVVQQHQQVAYDIAVGCSGFYQNSLEETIRMAESNALIQKSRMDGRERTTIVMAGQAV